MKYRVKMKFSGRGKPYYIFQWRRFLVWNTLTDNYPEYSTEHWFDDQESALAAGVECLKAFRKPIVVQTGEYA